MIIQCDHIIGVDPYHDLIWSSDEEIIYFIQFNYCPECGVKLDV